MVVYPCDIHQVSRLLTGKKGQLKKEVPSVAMMTNFGFGPTILYPKVQKCIQNSNLKFYNFIPFQYTIISLINRLYLCSVILEFKQGLDDWTTANFKEALVSNLNAQTKKILFREQTWV